MYPRLIISIVLATLLQAGCNTVFNPDKTISSALASYVTDATTSNTGTSTLSTEVAASSTNAGESNTGPSDLQQFIELVDGQVEEKNSTDINIVPPNPAIEFHDIPPASPSTKISNNFHDHEVTKNSIGRHSDANKLTESTSRQQRELYKPTKKDTEQDQQRLIRIYDTINSFDPPRKAVQHLPPMIQRPILFDRSIVIPEMDDKVAQGSAATINSDISWKDSLEATIDHMQEELKSLKKESPDFLKLQKSLKILNSVETDTGLVDLANKLDSLKQTLPIHQFEAISQLIKSTDDQKSNLIAQLRNAVDQVAKSASLSINNVNFCTAVDGFGKFKPFDRYEFRPGDEVLLYCELQNFSETEHSTDDHRSTRKCHFDAQVEFLDEKDVTNYVESFANITDECQSDRKDFYLFFRFKIPKLLPGHHRIQIRFNDKIGKKKATLNAPIPFMVIK